MKRANQISIDYSSLKWPVSLRQALPFQRTVSIVLVAMVLLITLAVTVVVMNIISPDEVVTNVAAVVTVGLGILVFLGILYVRETSRAIRRATVARFAVLNNLEFFANVKRPEYPGLIFQEGNSRLLDTAVVVREGLSYEIGNYTYAVGYSSARTTYRYGYIRILQQRQLPNVVLISTKNQARGPLRNLMAGFKKVQNFELEGDFHKYFTVYAPGRYEADALYVLTPDVMAVLVDSAAGYDVEIVNNELYFYRSKPFELTNEIELRRALEMCRAIGPEIDHQTDFYADQKIDDRAHDVVATAGYRLRRRSDWLMVAYLAYLVFDIFVLAKRPDTGIAPLLSAIVAVVALVVTIFERINRIYEAKRVLKQHAKDLPESHNQD